MAPVLLYIVLLPVLDVSGSFSSSILLTGVSLSANSPRKKLVSLAQTEAQCHVFIPG